jgi:hypothetical protein
VKLKLHLIIMGTVCIALLLACVAVLVYDHVVLYATAENDLGILAEIFASNSAAALTFDDPKAARELLAGLKARRSIESAVIYSASGKVFASYSRENQQSDSAVPSVENIRAGGGRLKLSKRITPSWRMTILANSPTHSMECWSIKTFSNRRSPTAPPNWCMRETARRPPAVPKANSWPT